MSISSPIPSIADLAAKYKYQGFKQGTSYMLARYEHAMLEYREKQKAALAVGDMIKVEQYEGFMLDYEEKWCALYDSVMA